MIRRLTRRLASRFGPALKSDTAFLEDAYREILGRVPDESGLAHYRALLRQGLGRTAVLLSLMRSDEFRRTLLPASPETSPLPNLIERSPARYTQTRDLTNGEAITVFAVRSPEDFDEMERAILEAGYYEHPGVWNLEVDADKRVIAEIVAAFDPRRALELGCAAGAVLECLDDTGIHAEGIEISRMAIDRAPAAIRQRIHHGDLLTLDLPPEHDVVFGLDVFEHLNPNRLQTYIAQLVGAMSSEGFLFCNVPAFGTDPVFGVVFPFYVEGWAEDAAAGRLFSSMHVDDRGYPVHGHLTWADARWWASRFEAAGLSREVEIERALHRKYDIFMTRRAPARRAFFVFGRNVSRERRAAVLNRSRGRSAVLTPL